MADDISRVPASTIDELVKAALARIRLPSREIPEPVESSARSFLRRVELQSSSTLIYLNRSRTLQWWRSNLPATHGLSDDDITGHYRSFLADGEALMEASDELILKLPLRARLRGGRAAMLCADSALPVAARPDPALLRAIARAHRWKELLTRGEVLSIEALAKRLNKERRHVGRVLLLAFLCPDLTKAILQGTQPPSLRLAHLLKRGLPMSWNAQSKFFNCPQADAAPATQ
jgi:hypothetical protein